MAAKKEPVKVSCHLCGKEKLIKPSVYQLTMENTGRFYCCGEHRDQARRECARIKTNCTYCNKELTVRRAKYNKSESKRFFCNKDHYSKWNRKERVEVTCALPSCDKKVEVRITKYEASETKRFFCCPAHARSFGHSTRKKHRRLVSRVFSVKRAACL